MEETNPYPVAHTLGAFSKFYKMSSVQFVVISLQNDMQTFDSVTRANVVAFYCGNRTLCIQTSNAVSGVWCALCIVSFPVC